MSKSVLFVLGSFPRLSETFVLKQVKYLAAKKGIEVDVLSIFRDPYPEEFSESQINSHRSLLSQGGNFLKLLNRSLELLKALLFFKVSPGYFFSHLKEESGLVVLSKAQLQNKKYDIVISHFGNIGAIVHHLKLNGDLKNTPHYCIIHGYDVSLHRMWVKYKTLYQQMPQTTKFLSISNYWKKKMTEEGNVDPNSIAIHRMGVELEQFAFTPKAKTNDKTKLLTVCRYMEKKGLIYGVEAARILKEEGVDFQWKIVGDGPLFNEIKDKVNEYGLQDSVLLMGRQPHVEIPKFMGEADIFLLPSVTAEVGDMEGIPVVLMEAMARGTLTLTTIHSGIPELVQDNAGLLVPEKDPESIAEAVKKFQNLNDTDLQEMLLNANNRVKEEFDNSIWNQKLFNYIL